MIKEIQKMKLLTRKCPEAKASKYGVTLYVSDNDHFTS